MALVDPIEMRVNVESQQSGHQEYGNYRGVRPVPHAHRQRMTVVDLPLDRVLFRLHWRIPSAAYQKSSLIARPPSPGSRDRSGRRPRVSRRQDWTIGWPAAKIRFALPARWVDADGPGFYG